MRNSITALTDRLWDIPAAFVLLTRLPVPTLPKHAVTRGANSVWAYPVVGLVLGSLVIFIGWLCAGLGLPNTMTAGLMLATVVCLTGAMHEDGLADTVDGFWGGHDAARRLEIMKDSRIGTYGVLALIIAMVLRWLCYSDVSWNALLVALVLSRSMMPPLMLMLPHARNTGLSHSVGAPAARDVGVSVLLGSVFAVLLGGSTGLMAVPLAVSVAFGIGSLARSKVGGQTGDILGATQIIVEIAILLTFVSMGQ